MSPKQLSQDAVNSLKLAFTRFELVKTQERTRNLQEQLRISQRQALAYRTLLNGQSRTSKGAKMALPQPITLYRREVHTIWPHRVPAPVLQNAATTNTDHGFGTAPQIRGANGARIQLSPRSGTVYNLLHDSGLRINARFRNWLGRRPAPDRIGLLVAGRGGYSRIHVGFSANGLLTTGLNGRTLRTGQSARLADGGLLHVSRTGRSVYMRSQHGYTTTIRAHSNGRHRGLSIHIRNPRRALRSRAPLPGGLLGSTFRHPLSRRPSISPSHPASHESYEVRTGLFGSPHPRVTQAPLLTNQQDMSANEIAVTWQQINQQSVRFNMIQSATMRQKKLREKERKLEQLLNAALHSGNMDLAVLLLSAAETSTANELTGRLVSQMHQLQKQRQTLSAQMAQAGQSKDQQGTSQLQSLVTKAANIGTDISLLQTFLQDAIGSKRNIQEFASNWITQSHQTTRSIIQSIGR